VRRQGLAPHCQPACSVTLWDECRGTAQPGTDRPAPESQSALFNSYFPLGKSATQLLLCGHISIAASLVYVPAWVSRAILLRSGRGHWTNNDLLFPCLPRNTLMHMAQTYSFCSLTFTLISRIAWIQGRKRRACFTQAPARRGVSEARVEPSHVSSIIGGPYYMHYHAHNAIACVEATAFSSMTKFMDELGQHAINDVPVTRQDYPAAISSRYSPGSSFLCS